MIFKAVSQIDGKTEKSFFLEQINVYTRLVQCFCEKNNIEFVGSTDINIENELKEIGIINESSELKELKSLLGENYDCFETAVKVAISNKPLVGDLLDKLYNSKRKEMQ